MEILSFFAKLYLYLLSMHDYARRYRRQAINKTLDDKITFLT